MAEDNKIGLEIDIDDKAALAQIKIFNEKTSKIFDQMQGDGKKSSKIFDTIGKGIVYANQGIELWKNSLELVNAQLEKIEQASHIKNIAIGFEIASKSIGVNSNALMNAISASTNGAVSRLDAMRLSTSALDRDISAKAIPQLMKMAQAMAEVDMRGRSTEEIFNNITNAISTGTAMRIKDLGFRLTMTGDSQRDLNAVLVQGEKIVGKYAGKFDETGDKIKAYKNILGEAIDQMKVNALPAMGDFLRKISIAGLQIGETFKLINMSSPSQKLMKDTLLVDDQKAKIESLKQEIQSLETQKISTWEKMKAATLSGLTGGGSDYSAEDARNAKKLEKMEELRKAEAALYAFESMRAVKEQEVAATTSDLTNQVIAKKHTEHEIKQALLIAEFIAVNTEITNEEQRLQQSFQVRTNASAEYYNNLINVEREKLQNREITIQTFNAKIVQLEQEKTQKIDQMQQELAQAQARRNLDTYSKMKVTNNDLMTSATKMASSVRSLTDVLLSAATDGFTNMFEAIGSGSMSAGEAVKSALLGVLADIAANWGKAMFLLSIFPPNPAGMAAGLALMALGGLVRGMAGASKSSSSSSAAIASSRPTDRTW